ncbi:MAG: SUMF1/EgtB/PvdO family nonheme iron enzyme, partial [Chloroflexota bacterium]
KQYSLFVKETSNQPKFWNVENYNNPLQPVIGVTWYDAISFCNWLSFKLGYKYFLPTEQQWQRAAQGDDNRLYPWGDLWNSNNLNAMRSKRFSYPTYVSEFPSGVSPYGVMDMSGNVKEWCSTNYYNGDNDTKSVKHRVLRGGSWYYKDPLHYRCTARYKYDPRGRNYDFGFRIACIAN